MARVTRNDVAHLAGTSTAVVSWVLNNGPRPVAPATRERVLAAVAELGYEPNLIARAMRSSRTNTFGCIVPDSANAYYSEIARAVEQAAFRRGQVVLLGNGGYALEHNPRYLRTFANLRVDGVVVVRPDMPDDAPTLPLPDDLPVVYVHNLPPGETASAVLPDMAQAGRIATAHLFEHGHSDVAALTGVTHTGALAKAVDGWRSARQDAGLAAAAEPLRPSGRGHVGGYEFGLSWLPRKDRPTALFAATDGLAIGLLRAARELGVRVPEELAIVSCNGTDEAAFSLPTLTTVFHPIPAIGEAALDVLESILKGGPPAPSRSLPMALRSGRSCGCPSEPEHRTAP